MPHNHKSKTISGGPSSRGNITHGVRAREVGEMKFRVEGGKLISQTQFCKEANAAVDYFWSRRPHLKKMPTLLLSKAKK